MHVHIVLLPCELIVSVRLAYNDKTTQYAALKVLPAPASKSIAREIAIHRSLSHQNIIAFLLATEDNDRIYIMLEYAALGELFNYITPDTGIDEDLAQVYFIQLCRGLVAVLDFMLI